MRDLVSVVIPVFNRVSTLKDAVESILLCGYGAADIIVTDDGSSIDIEGALRLYFPRAKYIRLDNNLGVSAARNAAIKASDSQYIAFLDSDDLWLPGKLALQINRLAESRLALSHTGEYWYRNGVFIDNDKKLERFGGDIFEKVLDKCRVSPSTMVVRRDVFEKVGLFDERLRVCEDYEFILRASLHYSVDYIPLKFVIKRAVTGGSLSMIPHIESVRLQILERFINEQPLSDNKRRAVEAEIARKRQIVKNI